MSIWKRVTKYGSSSPRFWLVPAGAAVALGPLLAAGPTQTAPPRNFASLYRADATPLMPVLRREGDSLRLLLNHEALLPGSGPLGLRLTAWASYNTAQPLWQQTGRLRPYPGGSSTAPAQVLTLTIAANRLAAGQVLQVSLLPLYTHRLPAPAEVAGTFTFAARPAGADSASASDTGGELGAAPTAWLPLTTERLTRPFVLLDSAGRVLDRPFVREGAAITVATYGASQPVRWRRYATGAAALPPFADPRTQPAGPRRLAVLDSSAAPVGAGTRVRLPKAGLVALRVGEGLGGTAGRTVPLLVVRPDFPGQTTAAELIENLLYLTSAAERQTLAAAPDPKRALDRFWLQAAGGDQGRARDLIRRYYGHVTAANELFSGHKPGWRTDRGLLYVVLGPPQRVRRTATDEQWHYDHMGRLGEPADFTFRARPSTLAPDNYELVRRPEYEPLWYAAVEQWRTPPSAR